VELDHLVYGVPDLQAGVDALAERLGVRAAAGGRHAGRGTHNALLGLGPRSYLELIAVDPDQPAPTARPLFPLDRLRLPRLVGWAVSAPDVDARVRAARGAGVDLGPVEAMGRVRPDGTALAWRLTLPSLDPGRLAIPFLIDWGTTPHPAAGAPGAASLASLHAEHPAPAALRATLAAMGVDLEVRDGPEPALLATLDGPRGRIVLR
jgi:hypothetical protein